MKDSEYNFNNNNNAQILEYIKALRNLENELQKKEYEISTINNSYQNLKKLNINLSQECQNLNEKNISLTNEKTELEKKYEKEIENLNSNFKKKELEYQLKLSNFSSFNENIFKNKIETNIINQYEEKILSKDSEILEQNKLIDKLTQDNELLKEHFQSEKEGLLQDINTLKNLHKTETSDLLQRIQILKNNSSLSIDDTQFSRIKNELEYSKHQINILTNENFRLKKDNERLIKEKNQLKNNNIILEGKVKLDEKKNETEIKRLNNILDNLKIENNNLSNTNKTKDDENKLLYSDKINLSNKLTNKELECQELQTEINVLNDLLKSNQEELESNLIQTYKNKKESLLKERINEENYKKEIDNLNFKLKQNIKYDNIEEVFNDKEKEIIKLKKRIFELENKNEILKKKYNDIAKKKNSYKTKCKETNEKIEKMIKKLNPEQEKEFKNIFDIDNKNNNNISEFSESGAI